MYKFLLSLIFLSFSIVADCQKPSVDNSIFGVQIGFPGIWIHNELKIANPISLRTELGVDFDLSDFSIVLPRINIEPRWYYNLQKRVDKSKQIKGNIGNFIALKSGYRFRSLDLDSNNVFPISGGAPLLAKYGIRRNIGNHFIYELGFGYGLFIPFGSWSFNAFKYSYDVAELHIRFGYRF